VGDENEREHTMSATTVTEPEAQTFGRNGKGSPKSVETVSTYGAVKKVNEWLKEDGFDKTLPNAMIYNYSTAKVNDGKNPTIPVEAGRIKVSDLRSWYDNKYKPGLEKRLSVVAEVAE
jgi:hypothetical protein